jgi:hypothetical protein
MLRQMRLTTRRPLTAVIHSDRHAMLTLVAPNRARLTFRLHPGVNRLRVQRPVSSG